MYITAADAFMDADVTKNVHRHKQTPRAFNAALDSITERARRPEFTNRPIGIGCTSGFASGKRTG